MLVLYKRPAFLGVFFALCFIVVVVLLSAHVLEWSVHHSRHARAQQDSRERDKSHRDAAFERLNGQAPDQQQDMDLDERQPLLASKTPATTSDHHAESHRLLVAGLAYGSCSGALSGLGLLFAKTGVELLILSTVGGQNQFGHWQAWMIVLVLLVTDLTQLWYLNHSLRLLGPTLICPLACCFYNLSSIFNGLSA